ncbi:hypothetical protein KPH14_010590 [Odynerus spinipes]|uniref:Small ribosomal subunit protein mS39 n=1 Tax=Odynerus spinipes TaxID=1348599 RepID=A0AAD9VTZ8_9HYME|nr:hypothetical protein KPH14_010590 [Odynerus spinipes]
MNVLTNTSCRRVKDVIKRWQSSSSTASSLDIKIPNRIQRGPTDILRMLERTVSKDLSAPHYKYHDDPYLIPLSKQEQRYRALSLESGRKAAMWVYREHADLFQHDKADPIIPEFLPPVTYTTKDQVSEEALLNTISKGKTSEALQIYKLLDENVSTKAKQSLLELLCFSNSKDLEEFTLQEERWFKISVVEKKQCVWNETEEIKKLSKFLMSQDDKTVAAAYNTLICGMAKYFQINKAWSLYITCKENNIPLNINAYNAIIKIIPLLKGPLQEPSSEVFKLLKEMSLNGIRPNVGTLNAALETIHSFTYYKKVMKFIHSLLGEFKTAGIKPSLASYHLVLVSASQHSESVASILYDILNVLEKDTLTLCDPNDINFFPLAMNIANKKRDRELGERIHALLLKDDNCKFITTSFVENSYYRHYVLLNLTTLPIEEFFKLYYGLSMNIYIPEALTIEKILTALQHHSKEIILEHLPKLWSQIHMFHMTDIEKVIKLALDITCSCDFEPESPCHETFANHAWSIWQFKQSKISEIRQTLWDATILGKIMLLLLRASWYDQTLEIIYFMIHKAMYVMGALEDEHVNKLLEICILHGYGPIALLLIKYASMSGLEDTAMMARKVYNVIPLNATEKEELINLVGSDVLHLQLSNER